MKHWHWITAGIGLAIIGTALQAQASTNTVGEPLVTWQKRSIRVCWRGLDQPTDFSEGMKKMIQKAVQSEFTLERTGIEFVGWEECCKVTKENPADLKIYQDTAFTDTHNATLLSIRKRGVGGTATLGEGSEDQIIEVDHPVTGEPHRFAGYFQRNVASPFLYLLYSPTDKSIALTGGQFLKMTAIHEFGHVAGLRHEHVHEAAKRDPNCIREGWVLMTGEKSYRTTEFYGEYDPNSIMNYCWQGALSRNGLNYHSLPKVQDASLVSEKIDPKTHKKTYEIKIGLSQKDVMTLKKLYP